MEPGWPGPQAAGHLAGQSPCEKRLLIVLTDASPNDEQRMAPVSGAARGKVYSGDAGIEDTAMEVRQLKKQGIKVMAVFYGLDSDLEAPGRYTEAASSESGGWVSLRIRSVIC